MMLEETKVELSNKKDKGKEIAEGLVSTAPFREIISAIFANRKKEKDLTNFIHYTVNKKRCPNRIFYLSDFLFPSQPRNTFSDDWDGALTSGFFEQCSHKSLMPWMITKLRNSGKADPLTDTLVQRYYWDRKWSLYKDAYYKKKKKTIKWFEDSVLYCPKICVEMAEHLAKKPDPYFDDSYNWYYAGNGNLLIVQFDNLDYIIHSEFNCLNMSPFSLDGLSIDLENTTTFKCKDDTNIVETIYSQSQHIIAIRTKCKVIILKVVIAEGVLRLDRLKEMDSEMPFTSIHFDEHHDNILYVTTLDYRLTIVNLDRMTGRSVKLRGKFNTTTDNWNSVIGGERGHFLHLTKKSITLYDKRTLEPFQRWKTFKHISDIQTCAKISAAKYCRRKPLMYVGTDHHLFLMDMRCGTTKDKNIKAIQRWSHGMLIPPTYIDICEIQNTNKEVVCLTSQWFEDMCIVNNYSDKLVREGEIRGLNMPYRPPSVMKTFMEAQRRRLCCDFTEPIRHRLCSAISGMSVTTQGDNYVVLTQNALGDISCHCLYPKHMLDFVEDDSFEKLDEWTKGFEDKNEPFEVSHVIDIKYFLRNLFEVPDDFILGRNAAITPRHKFNEQEIYDTFKNEELEPEFLEVWKEKNEDIELDKTETSQFFVDTS